MQSLITLHNELMFEVHRYALSVHVCILVSGNSHLCSITNNDFL